MSQNFPLVKQQTTIDPELVRQALLDLEVIIRKLEIEVGDIKKKEAWETDDQASLDGLGRGKLHLSDALQDAKKARDSGDPALIIYFARECRRLQVTGLYIERERQEGQRRAGGKHPGSKQTQAADDDWAPWQARFRELRTGASVRVARRQTEFEMKRAGFKLSLTSGFPSGEAIRKRLR